MAARVRRDEASGDLYAGTLVAALRDLEPGISVFGFGGARMAGSVARLVGDYRGFSVTGLVEALRVLPRSWRMLRRLAAEAERVRPDVFVAIDFPDFNFRLLPVMKRLGIPVVYYVSPQLWAWRPGRLRDMKALADCVLVIFPFEVPIYEGAGIPVEFVGHPLVDLARAEDTRGPFLTGLGLDPSRKECFYTVRSSYHAGRCAGSAYGGKTAHGTNNYSSAAGVHTRHV